MKRFKRLKGEQLDLFTKMAEDIRDIKERTIRIEKAQGIAQKNLFAIETVAHSLGVTSAIVLNRFLQEAGLIYPVRDRKKHIIRWEVTSAYVQFHIFEYVDITLDTSRGSRAIKSLKVTPKGNRFIEALVNAKTGHPIEIYKQLFPEEFKNKGDV